MSENTNETTGMFDTFVHPCLDCGTTVHVANGQTQPHDCADLPERERVAYAWWQGYDTAKATADAERAELRAEVEHWKDTTRLAMSALTTSRDVLHEASGLPEGIDDADVVDETVLALRTRTVKAEAERDRARSLAATLEARLAQVEALHFRRPWDFLRDSTTFGQTQHPDQCDHCRESWPCPTVVALKGDA